MHYCPFGNPGGGGDIDFQKWNRPTFDSVNASFGDAGFDLIHMESQPVFMPHFIDIGIPIVPSWHGML